MTVPGQSLPPEIPLFPLQTVLVPGGYLPLQIFEPRYLDMVRDCVRDETGFGVCLIMENEGPKTPSQHACVGTLARIRDWSTLENGLLGITAQGHQRFSIGGTRMRHNGLMIGEVNWITKGALVAVPDEKLVLSTLVSRFMDKLAGNYPGFEESNLQDAEWVGFRLTELLPLKNLERQGLLELHDPLERLQSLLEIIPRFQ
jgi:Lon protease-like protein